MSEKMRSFKSQLQISVPEAVNYNIYIHVAFNSVSEKRLCNVNAITLKQY